MTSMRPAVRLPALGVGTWAWGDTAYWGPGAAAGAGVVDAFVASLAAGVRLFDTAEVYGHGASEKSVGVLGERSGEALVLATKFAPLRGRGGARALRPALKASLARLRVPRVDLYQVHWADFEEASIDDLMGAMADVVAEDLVAGVGVSNFSAHELRAAHAALARRGIALTSNQVRYNALHRDPERDGVRDACLELGVTLLAYGPLEQGILAGTYAPGAVLAGRREQAEWFTDDALRAAQPLVALLRELAAERGVPMEQVALNWLRAKPGVVPLPGARSGAQAARNAGALAWTLDAEAAARIDRWGRG